MDAKQEMGEYTAHAMASLYKDDGFQQLAEAALYVDQINTRIALQQEKANRIRRLERMLLSPYFARVDFLFDGDAEKVKALEKLILQKTGFQKSYAVTGQTYTRKYDYRVLVQCRA